MNEICSLDENCGVSITTLAENVRGAKTKFRGQTCSRYRLPCGTNYAPLRLKVSRGDERAGN